MKLLYITNGINGSGGLERVLSVKASYLVDKLNYDVHILTLNDGDKKLFYEFSKKIVLHDIKVQGNPLNYFLSYKKGILKVLNSIKPDVISVCDDGLKGMMFPLIFGKKTPVIYERHASQQIGRKQDTLSLFQNSISILKFSLMNWGASHFNCFVVLTENNTKEWKLQNLKIIPNPIPFELTKKSKLSSKTVLVVGTQSYNKGYDRLLNIWKIVSEKHDDWKLEVYGKLNPSLGLELMSEELGISNTVSFYPPVKDIAQKYKEASIYLMTSRSEGFGMVLIEAMSFGVPCISFDCPSGPRDIITDGEDGFLVKNGDIKSFANALIKLLKNKELRLTMGEKASDNTRRYSTDDVMKQWDNLFTSLLD